MSHHRFSLTRRAALSSALALPFVGGLATGPARAAAPMMGASQTPFYRFQLGEFEVTSLLAGTNTVPDPHNIFGQNVSAEDFAAVSDANLIPADRAQFFFTPTLVNTGAELILFDTGLNGEGIVAALAAAGYSPDQIDRVVITHMHGDHIGGLMRDGAPTFVNAAYVTGAQEFDAWDGAGDAGFDANVRPLAERMDMLDDGGSVTGGITAMLTPGHTPGHMAYHLESGGQQLVLIADAANHYVWSVGYPDWEVSFDQDKATAAATRRALMDMLAADRIPFIGYHMPFPALGYVAARDQGFHYIPASYQLMMG
ncbi:MAG: MBL fold metallo-hydrolase [Paracoccaceae bacterium]